MAGIHPRDIRRLGRGDIEIDDDGILAAPHHHYFDGLVGAGVQLLVRDERRHENEIAGTGFIGELEPVAPPPLLYHGTAETTHSDAAPSDNKNITLPTIVQ